MRELQAIREAPGDGPAKARSHTAANPSEARARSQLALSYFNYGDMYLGVADRADSAQEKKDNLAYARSWYEKSLDIWRGMQQDGALHAPDIQYPDQASQRILKCDKALTLLGSAPPFVRGS